MRISMKEIGRNLDVPPKGNIKELRCVLELVGLK